MSRLPIRYVSFDCYGTLIDFRIGDVARERLAARVPADLENFTAYRFDDVCSARGSRIERCCIARTGTGP